MATSVTGSIQVTASVSDARTAISGAAKEGGTRSMAIQAAWSIASGTSSGQADKCWSDTRSIGSGLTDSLDLAGTLTNSFGETMTFVKVKGIAVAAAAANTTTLQVSKTSNAVPLLVATSSNSNCNVAAFGAGGAFLWMDPVTGITVTAGTTDVLQIINAAGATASYDILVVGTSA